METTYSPDGRFTLQADAWEARNSQWVLSPTLVETASGESILSFANKHWSLDSATWQNDTVVQLKLRRFPGDHLPSHLIVQVDCAKRSGCIESNKWCDLAELEAQMNAAIAF